MENKNKKFKIVTMGCRTNQYESQAYHDQLAALGYTPAGADEEAEVCIVNTCTVTESADSSSRHAIRQLIRENKDAKVLVTGCFAERQPDEIRKIDSSISVVPNKEKEQLLSRIFPQEDLPEFSIRNFDSHTRAFVKVQDGCNSYCTYCIIPYVRGRSRSRAIPEVLDEVRGLISKGYKEVVITGINVGDFDGNNKENPNNLADLVRAIDQIPGLERLRISSIDPDEVDDNLLDAVINGKKTCPSMHIVLQSGSNVVLKRMNRKYTRQVFCSTIDRLRTANPDFTFTTDVIVGFPGETDADFMETLEVMDYVKFAKVHMFPYSDRPRTRSATMPNKVSVDIIKDRKQQVLRKSEQGAFTLRQAYLHRKMSVLTESLDPLRPNGISGHTSNFLPVWIEGTGFSSNQIIEVELVSNTAAELIGRPI